MSYLAGTKVLITGTFRDPDTDLAYDPDDVTLTHWPPPGTTPTVLRYSTNDIQRITTGQYRAVIDTTSVATDYDWPYILEGTGNLAIGKKRYLRIRAR